MNSFPTPANYHDGYTDATRPDGMPGAMSVSANEFRTFYWSRTGQVWSNQSPVTVIQITPTTPFGSPTTIVSTPSASNYASSSATATTGFPRLQQLTVPTPNLTAQYILDIAPETSSLQYSGIVHNSSDSNYCYGDVGPLSYWHLPSDLAGYPNLNGRYHYPPPNPLAAGITEGDTVLTAITAFFQPVDMVLHQNSYGYRL